LFLFPFLPFGSLSSPLIPHPHRVPQSGRGRVGFLPFGEKAEREE